MKITKAQLKRLIKEELGGIQEQGPLSGPTRAAPTDPLSGPTRAGPTDPLSGPTRGAPEPAQNKKLALVAKELQLLLKKILAELE